MSEGTSAATINVGTVISADAEQAIRLLMSTMAQHVRQEALLATAPRPRGRLRALPTSSASHQARTQSTLLRLVSIVEAHVASQLIKLVEPEIPTPRTPILNDIYLAAEDQAIASWPRMGEFYKKWLNVRLSSYPQWQTIESMTTTRNAIAHGVGELTRRQARRNIVELAPLFGLIEVEIDGTRIQVSEVAIKSTATAGRSFIVWLDGQLPDK